MRVFTVTGASLLSLAMLAGLGTAPRSFASDPSLHIPQRPTTLEGDLAVLNAFVGDWEIQATWSHGATLTGRNEYRVGTAGRFLEATTFVRDNQGPVYERYHTVFAKNPAGAGLIAYGFQFDGTSTTSTFEVAGTAELPVLKASSTMGQTEIRQTIAFENPDRYRWHVEMRPPGGAWATAMDDHWQRVR
ncbi:MAG: hypothetical protein AAF995_08635 [Planctomycetota bacterium]